MFMGSSVMVFLRGRHLDRALRNDELTFRDAPI